MISNPYLCGLWDGVNLWTQWDDTAPDAGYKLQVRYRNPVVPLRPPLLEPPPADWGSWQGVQATVPLKKAWMVFPTWHEGWDAQVQVGIFGQPEWFPAQEVTFLKSTCEFSFTAGRLPMHCLPGTEFSMIIDGASCTYRLDQEIELAAGESATACMTAGRLTGWCQLDYPGHFTLRPSLGVIIANTGPSMADVKPTGLDFTTLAVNPAAKAPVKLVLGRNILHGNPGAVAILAAAVVPAA